MPTEAEQIRQQLRTLTEYARANQDRLTTEQKARFVRTVRSATDRLKELGIEQDKRPQAIPPAKPLIPDTARLLWVASGGEPKAFVQYLHSYPDQNLDEIRRNPQRLIQTLKILAEEIPEADVTGEVREGVPNAWLPSSNIWGFNYDRGSGSLLVKFNGKMHKGTGPVYRYANVPKEVYDVFSAGAIPAKTTGKNRWGQWWTGKNPSLGAALHQLIKVGGYPYQKISG